MTRLWGNAQHEVRSWFGVLGSLGVQTLNRAMLRSPLDPEPQFGFRVSGRIPVTLIPTLGLVRNSILGRVL